MRYLFFLLLPGLLFTSCKQQKQPEQNRQQSFGPLAVQYVRLGLTIGRYDPDFVDAYYGPDSLKPAAAAATQPMPKDSLLQAVAQLKQQLEPFTQAEGTDQSTRLRARWMTSQLTAFSRRIRIASGELATFDEEARELFGVVPPTYPEAHYQQLVQQLDKALPGQGDVPQRMQELTKRFIIPAEKVDTVFRRAIAEARKITLAHYPLPEQEKFALEYVRNKPWNGYNWYKGSYESLIQLNLDLPVYLEKAIDLACHEGYPGHHVYNALLEQNLYRDKGWLEISLYPLFSPQSVIAEGSANYGIELAFPGSEKVRFAREVLLPLAGLDTTHTSRYFEVLALRGQLNYARNEVARGLLSGNMDEKEALRWLTTYCLFSPEQAAKSVSFIRKYRSYVLCYNYGQDLVRQYVEQGQAQQPAEQRWQRFGYMLSNPIIPADLQEGVQ